MHPEFGREHTSLPGDRFLPVLGLLLVALSMRAAIGVVGPLFAAMSGDLGLGSTILGFLGAAPPLAFAVGGLLTPALVRRVGLERALIVVLLLLTLGQAARALSGEAIGLVLFTFLSVLGIGAANVLLPPIVRRWFPKHIAGATSVYLSLLALSAAIPSVVVVPISDVLGWRSALAVWIVLPILAILPWWGLVRPGEERARTAGDAAEWQGRRGPGKPIVASPTAWALVLVMLLPSISIYTAAAILPVILVETGGLTLTGAGIAMGIVYVLGIPLAMLVPVTRRHPGLTLPLIGLAGAVNLVGWAGVLLAPAGAPFVWATLIGLGPITFPLAMFLVNLRSRAEGTTVALSGFVQGLAYLLAAVAALGLGLLHDATHSWSATLVLLAACSVVVVPGIIVLARGRFVDDELARATRDRVPPPLPR